MNPSTLRRLLPVAILLAGLATFLLLGLERYFSFEMLARHKATLTAWVAAHQVLAAFGFMLAYAVMVAFSLPIAILATPVGGFLFGTWAGAGLSVLGATAGSIAVFLAARYAFRDLFRERAGARLARFEAGFHHNDFSYLLFLISVDWVSQADGAWYRPFIIGLLVILIAAFCHREQNSDDL